MGLCNKCKKKGVKAEVRMEMQVDRISTCDNCYGRYWTASGEPEDNDCRLS